MIQYRLNAGYIPLDHWVHGAQGGGRNIGEACHMYDVFRFLAGAPARSVDAAAIDPRELPYARNDNFTATITYDDGSVASLMYTALGPKTGLGKEHITVFCDGEAFIVDDFKKLTQGERRLGAVAERRAGQGTLRGAEPLRRRDRDGRPVADSVRGDRRDIGRGAAGRGSDLRSYRWAGRLTATVGERRSQRRGCSRRC